MKALIVAQHDELLSHKHEIEHLQLLIAKLRRMLFGRSSEKISRQIEQLELRLEELESARAERGRSNTRTASPADAASAAYGRALPEHLPREVHTHLPPHEACQECLGQLRPLGEDISEMLERIPATYMVIRHVRLKFSCGRCQHIVQGACTEPALGALDRRAGTLVQPIVQAICQHVMTAEKLHADDTPVPVLAPGTRKTKTGRLWTYVRDDRPFADTAAPAVWFAYSPDREDEHPRQHLRDFSGTLQPDGYAGLHHLYGDGHIQEAACWAHVRRKFHDLHVALASQVAREAIERIGALYAIEREIRGRPPDERQQIRRARARPLVDDLRAWMEQKLSALSRKSEVAAAIRYALARWRALLRYIDDGRIELDNNSAERAPRAVERGGTIISSPDRTPVEIVRPRCTA